MLRKLPGKLQETSLSQPFFPSNKGRYACKLGDRFPKGILLTTHDHALLTKNVCALAPEYKGALSHLKERAQRAHYRTCYAWHARTCADRRARRVFIAFVRFYDLNRISNSAFEKPGGRAGLRNLACALHVASSVVCALRALFKNDLFFLQALARGSSW